MISLSVDRQMKTIYLSPFVLNKEFNSKLLESYKIWQRSEGQKVQQSKCDKHQAEDTRSNKLAYNLAAASLYFSISILLVIVVWINV